MVDIIVVGMVVVVVVDVVVGMVVVFVVVVVVVVVICVVVVGADLVVVEASEEEFSTGNKVPGKMIKSKSDRMFSVVNELICSSLRDSISTVEVEIGTG